MKYLLQVHRCLLVPYLLYINWKRTGMFGNRRWVVRGYCDGVCAVGRDASIVGVSGCALLAGFGADQVFIKSVVTMG